MTPPSENLKSSLLETKVDAGTIEVAGKKLEVLRYPGEKAEILMLGGGANLPLHDSYYPDWQKTLSEFDIGSISFNYRGVGASGAKLEDTSLQTRLEDARTVARQLHNKPLFISGVSMGAPLAIRLASELQADGLILISPAAYSAEAYTKNFGPEFSHALRRDKSWEDSPDFAELASYQGRVILAYGKQDEVIPHPVLQQYAKIVNGRGAVLSFDDIGHRFMREENFESKEARNQLNEAILRLTAEVKEV